MNISKTPFLFKQIRKKKLLWEMPPHGEQEQKRVFLTFDDGPIPVVTEEVLQILDEYQAKATFFMVGDNVRKYPEEYRKVIEKGHTIGNHTHHHIKGWSTSNEDYLDDIELANEFLQSNLFRPPYGRIRLQQINALTEKYKIVMWSVLSVDYDKRITPEQCVRNVIDNTKDGSIIVFHDSLKARKNLLYALPKVLKHLSEEGYAFKSLKDVANK
jgi:peptidoglycan/xylan/chitin deacetylase (PgdA/CDA1 family)